MVLTSFIALFFQTSVLTSLDSYSMSTMHYIHITVENRIPHLNNTWAPNSTEITINPYSGNVTRSDYCIQNMVEGPDEELDGAPWGTGLGTKYVANDTVAYFGPTDTQNTSKVLAPNLVWIHTIHYALDAWFQEGSNLDTFATGHRTRHVESNKTEYKGFVSP